MVEGISQQIVTRLTRRSEDLHDPFEQRLARVLPRALSTDVIILAFAGAFADAADEQGLLRSDKVAGVLGDKGSLLFELACAAGQTGADH